jgi:hypothetical protein
MITAVTGAIPRVDDIGEKEARAVAEAAAAKAAAEAAAPKSVGKLAP